MEGDGTTIKSKMLWRNEALVLVSQGAYDHIFKYQSMLCEIQLVVVEGNLYDNAVKHLLSPQVDKRKL